MNAGEIDKAAQLVLLSGIGVIRAERELRWAVVNAALRKHNGNFCRAARELRIHRNTLARDVAEMRDEGREIYKRKPPGRKFRLERLA